MSMQDSLSAVVALAGQSSHAARLSAELNFVTAISRAQGGAHDALIASALDALLAAIAEEGGIITKSLVGRIEEMLMPLAVEAKRYRVHCIAHAHIDMNWMWGFQETASVTVDTFRTVLDLMEEYPTLTFGQSQASTYRIIEEYAPEMLEEIKARIREGRWEVTASTWVETDKNMPSGESLARHILYTKRYLGDLLDMPYDSFALDFEPDTFGHNISVPEICTKGGVKYYYHCRGTSDPDFAYRWRARSGAELLVWREPQWYNYDVNPDMFRGVPQLCAKYGLRSYLSVFGVGDHGGGPTRRDVTRLLEYATWPLMPTIEFSTFGRFYEELEAYREVLPVKEGELNFIFTGCYTSQSRIKMANRLAEDRMYESEVLGAGAHLWADGPDMRKSFATAWEHILFNHFHDILPGSGVIDTREYALGQFQRGMATIQTNAGRAMRALAAAIDTSSIAVGTDAESRAEGAAAGFMTDAGSHFALPRAERGMGKRRVFHLFNTTQYDFDGVTDITVWDWHYDPALAHFTTAEGEACACQFLSENRGYWGHHCRQFAVQVKIPAMGYETFVLDVAERPPFEPVTGFYWNTLTDDYSDDDIVLENDRIRAMFDHGTMQLLSLSDKATDRDLLFAPAANFRLIQENLVHGMTSWRVGDCMKADVLNSTQNVRVHDIHTGGLRKWIRYDLPFGERSKLSVTVRLDEGSRMLDFDVTVDFHEISVDRPFIPQLNFHMPVGYEVGSYRYDVPFGTIDRPAIAHDVPANSFAVALPADQDDRAALMLISDSKYGFRGDHDSLALDLIRASLDPDPYPEYGIHHIRLGVGIVEPSDNQNLFSAASAFVHAPALCSARPGKGTLPVSGRLFAVEGDVHISAVKTSEDRDGLTVRFADANGHGSPVRLTFGRPLSAVFASDLGEYTLTPVEFEGCTVTTAVEPYGIQSLIVCFA